MDLSRLASIDDDLGSEEVSALCFLCRDVLSKRGLKEASAPFFLSCLSSVLFVGVRDGKDLFTQLDQKDLLSNSSFLSELLLTIKRPKLLGLLEPVGPQTDSIPMLSDYRVMLYNLYEDMTEKNVKTMKFLLSDSGLQKVGRGQIEQCTTALDVFSLMEDSGQLSGHQLDQLHAILQQLDAQLAITLQKYKNGVSASQPPRIGQPIRDQERPRVIINNQRGCPEVSPPSVPNSDTSPTGTAQSPFSNSDPNDETHQREKDFYTLRYKPRGTCMVINNEHFETIKFKNRSGTQEDESKHLFLFRLGEVVLIVQRSIFTVETVRKAQLQPRSTGAPSSSPKTHVFEAPVSVATPFDVIRPKRSHDPSESLQDVFGKLGFQVEVHSDLTAGRMRSVLNELGKRSFTTADVLVVCVLSHGDKECVFGTDGKEVTLSDLRGPFTSERAPTLAGKPKLFFVQACQGSNFQRGSVPCPPRPQEEEPSMGSVSLEADAGPLAVELVAGDADFLMGMATVEECKSFRNTSTGSIYIQELCRQLLVSAKRNDDLLTTLTRVNREVSKQEYLNYKQMPQPKYTLTKKLVLTEMALH
ncbi:Caspase-8 [Merluccius polli]|uniref:Caspase-8 n=1 Tax=Merluccius polli TaxID=89951 RepID=A0AA47M6T1_MERPO|nr:Caspase-8 [Merluccius polli]